MRLTAEAGQRGEARLLAPVGRPSLAADGPVRADTASRRLGGQYLTRTLVLKLNALISSLVAAQCPHRPIPYWPTSQSVAPLPSSQSSVWQLITSSSSLLAQCLQQDQGLLLQPQPEEQENILPSDVEEEEEEVENQEVKEDID